ANAGAVGGVIAPAPGLAAGVPGVGGDLRSSFRRGRGARAEHLLSHPCQCFFWGGGKLPMRSCLRCLVALAIALSTLSSAVQAAYPPPAGGVRINNLKVQSDKIDDVTTIENILKSIVKPVMSNAERSKAIWTAAVKYRPQTTPPDEQLSADWEAHDPVKFFNTYGYCRCCCCSAIIEALNREDGRQSRGRILNGHSVPEVFYANGWHMYD